MPDQANGERVPTLCWASGITRTAVEESAFQYDGDFQALGFE